MTELVRALEQIPRTPDESALNALAERIKCSPHVTLAGVRIPAINVPRRLSRASSETRDRNLRDERGGGLEVCESVTIFLAAKNWPLSLDERSFWAELVPVDYPKWDHEVRNYSIRDKLKIPHVIIFERIGTKKIESLVSAEIESTISETPILKKPYVACTEHAPLYRSVELRLYCDRRTAQDALREVR